MVSPTFLEILGDWWHTIIPLLSTWYEREHDQIPLIHQRQFLKSKGQLMKFLQIFSVICRMHMQGNMQKFSAFY